MLAFVTAAREGSVSRAAEVLYLTQPAVSHQFKRLRQDTGITLFRRTPRGLGLTSGGAAILPKAAQLLNAMAEYRRSTSPRCGQVSGRLRTGTIVDPEFIRLGRLLSGPGTAHPIISTELAHGVSGEILGKLERRQIGAGYYLAAPDEVDAMPSDQPRTPTAKKAVQHRCRIWACSQSISLVPAPSTVRYSPERFQPSAER
ncbi:LysR family transcriptional regulator [Cribrihabitans neustonicus]|uniref:LysR family transcriptional regulator n=1 Tax=Cribrihabitans neustonicus TaxID=1429085 RepID=UPI003B59F389